MDTTNTIRVGRIAGIEIRVHYTWVFVAVLVAWSLAGGYFPARVPGRDGGTYWLAGIVAALAFFASVLLHELAHSLVALRRGLGVSSITLFIFGGVSNISAEPSSPGDDFLIAIVGPLMSLFLGVLFRVLRVALTPEGLGGSIGSSILDYLSVVNLMLGGFNLLPGLPLDGGRVFRAIVWKATGSVARATAWAARAGQVMGMLLVFAGVARALSGAFLDGLWIAFVGWFLSGAAESTRRAETLRAAAHDVRVRDLMDPHPDFLHPGTSVEDFVFQHVIHSDRQSLPVVDQGRLLGIVSIGDVKQVPQPEWATAPVEAIMTPAPLKTISPDARLDEALSLLVDGTLHEVPVVQDGELIGLLSRNDLLRYLSLSQELHLGDGRLPAERARSAA